MAACWRFVATPCSVIEAAMRAGAKNAYVVKEPILAAIGAGIPIYEARGHMVVDIGGGTTDVAVISLGGIVASTSVKCAGNRIDQAIADYIKKTFNLAIGDKTAEDIKIQIGSAVPLEDELTMTIKGRDFVAGLPRSISVSTNEIVKAIDKELREDRRSILHFGFENEVLESRDKIVFKNAKEHAIELY
jgi:rod shape-determining protein MreB